MAHHGGGNRNCERAWVVGAVAGLSALAGVGLRRDRGRRGAGLGGEAA